ncbi:hypothetical protein BBBOND_0109300 [Babesia bigemina]|uniref:Uncharacterized protein n=1 Tax=Babesia bigemina TaxID=5866 RepID=A0A061D3H8_BABBI|nr:hypothetical protein BBBOND_0109300 [Babesia bigemina]CDR94632.1 hypothetical protein BBBOND_0109300 [Babesia bigemina]|eukprot:XP_012766818.1 hypothetical protein BBBOND_0109300 [Babesia bigemina]
MEDQENESRETNKCCKSDGNTFSNTPHLTKSAQFWTTYQKVKSNLVLFYYANDLRSHHQLAPYVTIS